MRVGRRRPTADHDDLGYIGCGIVPPIRIAERCPFGAAGGRFVFDYLLGACRIEQEKSCCQREDHTGTSIHRSPPITYNRSDERAAHFARSNNSPTTHTFSTSTLRLLQPRNNAPVDLGQDLPLGAERGHLIVIVADAPAALTTRTEADMSVLMSGEGHECRFGHARSVSAFRCDLNFGHTGELR